MKEYVILKHGKIVGKLDVDPTNHLLIESDLMKWGFLKLENDETVEVKHDKSLIIINNSLPRSKSYADNLPRVRKIQSRD